jgi:hypothetical protein
VSRVCWSIRVAPQIAEQWEGEAVYVARLPTGPIFVLDAVGGLIWREATTRSSEGMIDRLARQLDVDPEHIASDVRAFIDELIGRGLLVEIEDGLGY